MDRWTGGAAPGDTGPASPRLWRVNVSPSMLVVTALLAAGGLSACGPNFDPQTGEVYNPAAGVSDYSGEVDYINALVVSDPDGRGRLIGGLVNNDLETDDMLTEVRAAEGQDISFQLIEGDPTIPAGGLLSLSEDENAPVILVEGAEGEVTSGGFVELVLTFANADSIQINVPVLSTGEEFADVEIPDDESFDPAADDEE